ncbi:hypothetical protein [Leclercia sp. 119287]|uniref:gp53-like domain-containing protein n=1 Tax=Leclercia sp. 119287 TaxID=2681308 RepID=UPI001E393F97|nr:hypothetical protein [Leclercia sp. 119287]
MHRIDTLTAQKDKFGVGKNGFTRGNPQTGTPATDLDDDYFDMLQEELAGIVEAAATALDKSKRNQVLTALKALFLARTNIGVGAGQVPDMSAFASSLAVNGYQKLPGGLIIQQGMATPTVSGVFVSFPIPFPQGPFVVTLGAAGSSGAFLAANNYQKNGFTFNADKAPGVPQAYIALGV